MKEGKIKATTLNKSLRKTSGQYNESKIFINGKKLSEMKDNRAALFDKIINSNSCKFKLNEEYILKTNSTNKTLQITFDI